MRRGEKVEDISKHAEEVRKRRTQRSQQRVNNASTRVVNPVVPPRPVTFRGGEFGTPIHRQNNQRARRQFYVTVDQAAGAELRLPSIPLVNPGWRIMSFLLVVLALVGIFSMMNSPFFRIYTVSVTGLQRLSAEDINAVVNLNNLSILEVNAADVQQAVIRAFPELVEVHLEVSLPNTVSIQATERQPVIAFSVGDQVVWADADGVLFPARGDAGPLLTVAVEGSLPLAPEPVKEEADALEKPVVPAVPVIPGITQPEPVLEIHKIDSSLLLAAQGLTKLMPPDVQLVYNSENGLGWTDPQGWAVYVGRDLDSFEAKFVTYQEIVNQLNAQGQRPVMVSVAHLNAPYFRLEQ